MKYLILNLCFFFCISTTYIACSSSVNTTSTTRTDSNYQLLSIDKSIKDYVDQKIYLEGTESLEINQHMMKTSFSLEGEAEEKHLYIDYNNGQQIVGYYKNIRLPKDQKKHKFYGTARKMSGAGKGGGTFTEYYLDLDKVE
jgi:hypothetical protein